jgi:hypothetical protein
MGFLIDFFAIDKSVQFDHLSTIFCGWYVHWKWNSVHWRPIDQFVSLNVERSPKKKKKKLLFRDSDVSKRDLRGQELNGTISASIGQLTALDELCVCGKNRDAPL